MAHIQRINEYATVASAYPGGRKKYFQDYEDAAYAIIDNDNYMDISDYGFTYNNQGITALSTEQDVNGTNVIWVHFDDDDAETLDQINDKDLTFNIFDILL